MPVTYHKTYSEAVKFAKFMRAKGYIVIRTKEGKLYKNHCLKKKRRVRK